MNAWDQIKQRLASRLTGEAWENWLSRTAWRATDGQTMRVTVPDEVTRQWLQQEYAAEIWTAVHDLGLAIGQIIYELASAPAHSTDFKGAESGPVMFSPSMSLN